MLQWAMACLAAAMWFISRPYHGIYHDARLYTLQALGRLHPESLGRDVFLRFGSQDAYTLFSPLYAATIRVFGVEDAARLLTSLGHIWWFGAACFLARRLLGLSRGMLAVAVIAALPGYYGSWDVFQYAEPFLTPRLFAEASVLSALAALLAGRRPTAFAFALLAMLLHPLMGMAGLLVVTLEAAGPKWRFKLITTGLAGLAAAILIAVLAPHYPLSTFDETWLSLARGRSPFLVLTDWGPEAWSGVAASLVPLWIVTHGMDSDRDRRLIRTVLAVGVLGLAITAVGATLFNVVLITQGQAWRWIWLSAAVLPIAAVGGFATAWRSGVAARGALLLSLAGWLLIGWPAVALFGVSLLVWAARRWMSPRQGRAVELVCIAVAVVAAVLWFLSRPGLNQADMAGQVAPPQILAIRLLCVDGIAGVGLILIAWFATRSLHLDRAVLVGAVAFLVVIAAMSAPDWTRHDYSGGNTTRIRTWQAAIPEDAEVLWPGDPADAWLLLGRRSFLSLDQTAGILFSRDATMEMLKRSKGVDLILPPAFAFRAGAAGNIFRVTESTLLQTCQRSDVDFVVLGYRLRLPLAAAPMTVLQWKTRIREPMYLYSCAQLRALPASAR